MKQLILSSMIVLTAIILGVAYAAPQLLKLKQDAIQGCIEASVYRSQRVENGVTITTEEPIEPAVQKCLQLKGLK